MFAARRNARTLLFASLIGVSLAAAPLVALPASAAIPAGPVAINLLNINDFHGRIDRNTVKVAGTIEQLRAEYAESTLLLSAGDNIGASVFASSSQLDVPTIDVLNELGLAASAVGNHEFDAGFADLTGRVKSASNYPILGANVYDAGTTNPAMKEFTILDVKGVSVAVIGAVTEETPALVSPGGISGLSFGDPVEAVNRVAAQLTDGDPANGEADVIVAQYHEGAGAGTPDGASLEQELALTGSAFARIVTETSASVNAIFTGHTHKQYAWDAPVPGNPGATRPVLQTGSYGENIGQVVLSYDPATELTSTLTNRNVKRTTLDDSVLVADYPRVAAVQAIVTKALADAAVLGGVSVGSVTADITRACIDGVAPCVEDRASASALGGLIANSLRESLADPRLGGADIGVVNPGGIRADLSFGSDGDVTYAEANAVLPFLNNLYTTTLTGAQFTTVLEQQWQTDADGNVPSRPYLQLGLSDNVNYTFDASRAAGDRITGVWVDGVLLDPAQSYRIGSFNFLLEGGDNFREFANGTDTRDSGLIDRDAWISYIETQSPLTPSFAARQAQVAGAPTTTLNPGDTFTLAVSGLNLSSLGAKKNTELRLAWSGSTTVFEPVTVDADGAATVTVTVPADAPAGSVFTLTATESNLAVRLAVAVNAITVIEATKAELAATSDELAATGVESVPALISGALLLLLGAGTLALRRRQELLKL